MNSDFSKRTLFLCYILFLTIWFFFYPRWTKERTEATISWDVSGYYFYLPAIFIYDDLKGLNFADGILQKYTPTFDLQQAFMHESGNFVMKYSSGQALVFLPFFALGHVYAKVFGYPADGFSPPYQFFISLETLIIAFAGLWFLRKILLEYFDELTTGITLFIVFIGTNYLNYSAIDGAMTHNTLFTIYCILIMSVISFYKHPNYTKAAIIGTLIGLAVLIRPTEIIMVLILLLWNLKMPIKKGIKDKLFFFKAHFSKLAFAAFFCIIIGSIQLIYWKYVSGQWVVYSYQDQGFSWLRPHIWNGMFSYKAGWLTYAPLMVFSLIGFIPLFYKYKELFLACFIFSMLFMYMTFAWDIWWYGGSLGQRAMVQAYPLLALPLGSFVQWTQSKKVLSYIIPIPVVLFIYCNLWWTYQAHTAGGAFHPEQMTKAYFWKVIGRYNIPRESVKLLDTNEEFSGERNKIELLYYNNFEADTMSDCGMSAIEGISSLCIDGSNQYSPQYYTTIEGGKDDWIRVEGTFRCQNKEWNIWNQAQMIVRFLNYNTEVKTRFIRIYRLLEPNETKKIYIDVKFPNEYANKACIFFWNAESDVPLLIDELRIEKFR